MKNVIFESTVTQQKIILRKRVEIIGLERNVHSGGNLVDLSTAFISAETWERMLLTTH
jgi:hypothetical protein